MFIRFDTIHERDGRTDGHTHRHRVTAKADAGIARQKLILDPHPDPDQHQNVITSRGSAIAHAYHV